MNVLVTGGSGLVGGYVVRELLSFRHRVTIFSRNPRPVDGVGITPGDIMDLDRLRAACRASDAIIHLAGITNDWEVPPQEVLHTNVIGTVNVLEAAVREGIGTVVVASSTAASGFWRHPQPPPEYFPFDEDHPVRPIDPYALSKLLIERTCRSYTDQHGIRTVCLRFSTRYVDQEGPRHIVPLASWGADTVEELWDKFLSMIDNPLAERWTFWAYVDPRDLARAYRMAAENDTFAHGTYYIVADDTMSRTTTAELLDRFFPDVPVRTEIGAYGSLISHRKATRELGWEPRHTWRENPYLRKGAGRD